MEVEQIYKGLLVSEILDCENRETDTEGLPKYTESERLHILEKAEIAFDSEPQNSKKNNLKTMPIAALRGFLMGYYHLFDEEDILTGFLCLGCHSGDHEKYYGQEEDLREYEMVKKFVEDPEEFTTENEFSNVRPVKGILVGNSEIRGRDALIWKKSSYNLYNLNTISEQVRRAHNAMVMKVVGINFADMIEDTENNHITKEDLISYVEKHITNLDINIDDVYPIIKAKIDRVLDYDLLMLYPKYIKDAYMIMNKKGFYVNV